MEKRKALLSFFLSGAILVFSQPAFAAQIDKGSHKTDSIVSVEIVSEESQPLTIDDLKQRSQEEASGKDTSSSKFVGNTKLVEDLNAKAKLNVAAATGPDLAIGNLEIETPTQPFPYADYVKFNMLVANIGNQSISNVKVTTNVDGTDFFVSPLGTFTPGQGGMYTIPLKGLCGKHQIKFSISGDATKTKSTNNSMTNSFVCKM